MNPFIQPLRRDRYDATREQGFSLVELAMVLLAVGLLAALFLPATNTLMDNNRRKETRAKLEALESAISRFVMTTKRLPCPADGNLAPGNANQGLELSSGGVCTVAALTSGVVPWRTLAVPQSEALDAWGNLVTYRVWGGAGATNSLTLANGMDMSTYDPATAGTVSGWLASRGFRACNLSPCAVSSTAELASKTNGNGVAYFLISHGANKFGAYNTNGTWVATANGSGPGALENINRNNQALRTTTPDDFYLDADLSENTATYYDDLVLRPTVIKVALDAGLGPRP
jgi:Tfp pilus assembly protein PilE